MKKECNFRNTQDQWGIISRLFHWVTAILIIGMLALGIYMSDYAVPPFKYELYGYHKAIGFLLLFFILFRLIWRLAQPVPSLQVIAQPFYFLMKASPYVLYFLLLMMPLSGIVMSQAGGHPISIFGWFIVPELIEKNEALSALANKAHNIMGQAFIAIIGLHFLASLFHQFILKDGLITRMWKGKR